ncbi:MAG: TetR family transcriptional regulator [Burkholderiaceae bacterium]|jgi:TetR/AcrR family acrAB operon transcriptional repressor|nr:TetR family transcriptional regulator [Burkholderiaceae bacterium]
MATRQALLDAAERVFERRGVSRTSLAEIAQEARLTRGAIYWHFQGKADLFNAMMERVKPPMEQALRQLELPPDAACDPLENFCAQMRFSLTQIENDAHIRRVLNIAMLMTEYVPELGSVRARHLTARRQTAQRLGEAVANAAARRNIALPASTTEIGELLHGLFCGMVTDWLVEPDFSLTQTTMRGVKLMLRGLGLEIDDSALASPPPARGQAGDQG